MDPFTRCIVHGYTQSFCSSFIISQDIEIIITAFCNVLLFPTSNTFEFIDNISTVYMSKYISIYQTKNDNDYNYYCAVWNGTGVANTKTDNNIKEANKISVKYKINYIYANCVSPNVFYKTCDGELYVTGFNEYGQLGLESNTLIARGEKITFFNKNKLTVKDIRMGQYHSLALCSYGNVYSCGADNKSKYDYGQNGHRGKWKNGDGFKLIDQSLNLNSIKTIRAGAQHSIFLTLKYIVVVIINMDH